MGVVDTAKSYIGKVKYVFGADDIDNGKGDCSSFTHTVFKKNDIDIGRDTNSQYQKGTEIDKENLQPGDLVFFKNTYQNNHKDGVSHVGIYEGNNKFIHLSDDGVKESSLDSDYYKKHYLGARRIDGVSEDSSDSETTDIELKWWGDIVNVIIAILLILGGIFCVALAIKLS